MSDNNESTTQELSKEEYLNNLSEQSMIDTDDFMSTPDVAPEDMFDSNEEVDIIDQMKAEAAAKDEEKGEEPKEEPEVEVVEEGEKEEEQKLSEETQKEEVSAESKEEIVESLSLDPEKTYKIKVDGKLIDISGAELQSKASGEIAVEKRFAEVDKQNKALYDKQQADQVFLNENKERILSGDIVGALADMFELPAYALKDNLLKSLEPEVNKRLNMTEEQVQAQRLIDERKYYKDSYESELRKQEEAQKASAVIAEQNALNQQIDQVRETHNISKEQWDAAYKALDSTLDPSIQEIPLDMVAEEALKAMKPQEATPAVDFTLMVDKATEQYSKHINDDFKKQLLDFAEVTPDLTEAQLSEIVKASVQKGLKEKLLGSESTESSQVLTKEQKLKELQEKALEEDMPNRPDSDKNWF